MQKMQHEMAAVMLKAEYYESLISLVKQGLTKINRNTNEN